ncbi:MAG TPA: flagellar protein FlaG [Janthinobacterium sp.]|jgi:flagellar protein FlaG|nr:flagellar protein FlaG [Janthinobacterium sp.]
MTIDSIGPAAAAATDRSVTGTRPVSGASAGQPAAADAAKGGAAAPSADQVDKALADLNKAAQEKTPGIEFSIDPDSKRTIVQVVDQSTREVLQQFPSKEALAIAKSIDDSQSQGVLINQTA